MVGVFDVAQYILERSDNPMSTMKLQKLCYYSQAWHLVWNNTPLFNEDFQAWANGAVCPELFLRMNGKYSVSVFDGIGNAENLSTNQKDSVDKVLEYYGNHDAWWLSQLICIESPWNDARVGIPSGTGCDNVITKESMISYYSRLSDGCYI